MSLPTQAKILRALQDGSFYRVGGHEPIRSDVRILAATHQDLERLIREGRFREDLYYRLRVVEVPLPPLRERKDDIPEVARYLIARHRANLNPEVRSLSSKAIERLLVHDWPGNIRELENILRRALVICNGSTITPDHLDFGTPSPEVHTAAGTAEDMESLVDRLLGAGRENLIEELEKLLIARALERLNGNQLRTARLLGITRNTLRSRIQKFGLKAKVNVS